MHLIKPQSSQQKVQNKGLCPVVSLCLQIKLNQLNFSPFQLIWSFHLKCTFHVSFHMDSCKSRSDAEMCVNLFLESGLMSRWNCCLRSKCENRPERQVWTNCHQHSCRLPPAHIKIDRLCGSFFCTHSISAAFALFRRNDGGSQQSFNTQSWRSRTSSRNGFDCWQIWAPYY